MHSAADTEYDWPFYGELVGAYFASHPAIQQATVRVENRAHAATAGLSPTWVRTDEWYNFRTNVRSSARVLATLDESTYSGGAMGADHPHTWCKTLQGGRSFYTGSGHTQASYAEAGFRSLLLGGIRYAANRTKADCRPETGYTTLYNGSTTGWSQAGPGRVHQQQRHADARPAGMGMLWYSTKEFRSYSLKLDWMMPGDDNSGVFIGFPASSDPNSAMNNGYEVQIDATDTPDRTTGAVYGFKSADIAARDAALNPPGEWNTFELLVEGERLQVFLNGVQDQRLHQHGSGAVADLRAHRHPEPRHRRRRVVPQHPDQGVGWHRARAPARSPASPASASTSAAPATADGTKIQLWTCNGGANQQLDRSTRPSTIARARQVHGRRRRRHRGRQPGAAVDLQRHRRAELDRRHGCNAGQPAVGQVPDAQGGGTADGTQLVIWTCSGAANQRWTLPS